VRLSLATVRFVLARLGLVAAGVLVALLLFEVALRLAQPIPEMANPLNSFHDSDPALGWRGKPSIRMRFHRPDFDALVENGPDGWRRPDPPPPAQPVEKVLFLGDSFTWGWGVNQGEVFTDELQRRLPPSIGVYNRGVNAFGTAQEYLLMQRELANGHYDKVVVMFFFNDVHNNIDGRHGRRPYFTVANGRLQPANQPAVPLMSPLTRFLKDHIWTIQLITSQFNALRDRFEGDESDDAEGAGGPDLDAHTLAGADETTRLLAAMQQLAREHGAELYVVWVPHRSELEQQPSAMPFIRAVHTLVAESCRSAGIPFIDLTQPFYDRTRAGARLIFPHDEHWNADGHRLAAEALLSSPVFASD